MRPYEVFIDNQCILYDADNTANVDFNWFDANYLERAEMIIQRVHGRGLVYIFTDGYHEYVLRHYWRGGVMASVLKDQYLWAGLRSSRAWREWFLLMKGRQRDLPVPVPYAARTIRSGLWYRCDLITYRCRNARSVSSWLTDQALSNAKWIKIGGVIKRMHTAGFDHADLNANNILVSELGDVSIIDFDKGRVRVPQTAWQMKNLARLKRSLRKLPNNLSSVEQQFDLLLKGYRSDRMAIPETDHTPSGY